MLEFVQVEFLKLRRKKLWLLFLAALIMPLVGIFYFGTSGMTDVTPVQFYKWTAFSFTTWLILPVVLGILCTMLMYDENHNDMLKQLWIIPVSKMGYFFSKFLIVLLFSVCFMLIETLCSVMAGVIPGIIAFTHESFSFLIYKCLEAGFLMPFAMFPVLAAAASRKGYVLPVCLSIVYAFTGFIFLMINMYIHPLSSAVAVLIRNIEGVALDEPVSIGKAFLCIGVWAAASTVFAKITLSRGI